jgi:hypothetical protein
MEAKGGRVANDSGVKGRPRFSICRSIYFMVYVFKYYNMKFPGYLLMEKG